MPIEIRLLGQHDADVLSRVADGVFDGPIDEQWTARFLAEPCHHIIVAVDDNTVVGMITAVDYVHPDKAPQLWINEVGVGPSHQRRGIARELLRAMLAHSRTLGCTEAWLGTEDDNVPARRLYEDAGSTGEPFVLYSFEIED
ncbi:MAG: GNAT family N-acetyltransferase [Gemmatimonadaceae bacterium]